MNNTNLEITSIDTDAALNAILGNFSDDYIEDLLIRAFDYKFRPFESRMPNYAYVFEQQYIGIKNNYTGPTPELIDEDREETFRMIINIICNMYNLRIIDDIPSESLYSLAYLMCQIFLSEFTDRLITFFGNYIATNVDSLINVIPEDQRSIKSTYAKKVYTDPQQIIVYENIIPILDAVASLDFEMEEFISLLADSNTANLIGRYIEDCGDLYKNHFASFIFNPSTRSQMITTIKINFVNLTSEKFNGTATGNLYMN